MEVFITDKEYNIHFYEANFKKEAFITSIMNYLGDVATQQSEDLGIGIDYMDEHKIAWIVYKWDIKIKRYPLYNEKINIKTYALGIRKFYAYRKHDIYDKDQNLIGEATSVWFLIDTDKRRPITVPDIMYECYQLNKEEKFKMKMGKLPRVKDYDIEDEFNVRYTDIDTNKHVNNVKYIDWAIETVPRDIFVNYTLNNIRVEYVKETRYGAKVKIKTKINEENNCIKCIHSIENEEGQRLTNIETNWIK